MRTPPPCLLGWAPVESQASSRRPDAPLRAGDVFAASHLIPFIPSHRLACFQRGGCLGKHPSFIAAKRFSMPPYWSPSLLDVLEEPAIRWASEAKGCPHVGLRAHPVYGGRHQQLPPPWGDTFQPFPGRLTNMIAQ